ncbi:MAG: TonB C-terminal domain-containing protein [Elusimicrobia bacterium]|nr:TonB C-terminal domain-containing protein [Elusimicrobiota bacterium]
MFKTDNFFSFVLISVLVHALILFVVSRPKQNPVSLTIPIEVTFFSPGPPAVVAAPPAPPAQAPPEPQPRRVEDIPRPEPARTEETIRIRDEQPPRPQPQPRPRPAPPPVAPVQAPPAPTPVTPAPPQEVTAPPTEAVAAPEAGGGSRISLDASDFRYIWYTNQIVRIISQNWQHVDRFGRHRAIIHFRIARDGSASDITVRESSGNANFDMTAANAVRRSRFPPLPDTFSEDFLGVNFEFSRT